MRHEACLEEYRSHASRNLNLQSSIGGLLYFVLGDTMAVKMNLSTNFFFKSGPC
jgi:hypothetical protein